MQQIEAKHHLQPKTNERWYIQIKIQQRWNVVDN